MFNHFLIFNRTVVTNPNNNKQYINGVPTAKTLGVIFYEKLTWTNHIQNNTSKTYGMLRNLWAVQNSTPPKKVCYLLKHI